MNETMNKNKMWSGRYLLCACAALAVLIFTGVLGYRLIITDDEKLLTVAMTMIAMTVSSVVTFYFTRQMPTVEK